MNRKFVLAALFAISAATLATSCSKDNNDDDNGSSNKPPVVVNPDDTPEAKTFVVTLPGGIKKEVGDGDVFTFPAPSFAPLTTIYYIGDKEYKAGDQIEVKSDLTITVERFATFTMEEAAKALPTLETECTITIADYDGSSMKQLLKDDKKQVHLILQMKEGVTEICDRAFYNCNSLVSIEVPEGVTKVGDAAFYECENLVSAKLPESLTEIGLSLLASCGKLTEVNIPSKLESLSICMFDGCKSLAEIVLPEGLTTIHERAFNSCSKLAGIKIPETVTYIGDYAFCQCAGFEVLNLPPSIITIRDYAFSDCDNLKSVKIPASAKHIGVAAFIDCNSLASMEISEGVEYIGYNAFELTALPSLQIPKSAANIGDYMFEDGHMLEVTVPASVEKIPPLAFYWCKKLVKITIEGNPEIETSQNYSEKVVFSNCDPSLVVYVTQQTYDKYHGKYPMMQVK